MKKECTAEFIDGSYDSAGCGCEDCCDDLHDDVEREVEYGSISEDEAHDRHLSLGYRGFGFG